MNLTDKDGKVTKKYTYDAFGVEKNIDKNDANAFRYCGEYFDTETGTVYLRARYYNPTTGRFISRDSFAGRRSDPLSLNLYTYCHNNPIIGVDPSGHFPLLAALAVVACTALLTSCSDFEPINNDPSENTGKAETSSHTDPIVTPTGHPKPTDPPTTSTVKQKNNSSKEKYDLFLNALGQRESTSNYSAKNDQGYLGMWQMYPTQSLVDAGYTDLYGNWTEYANEHDVYSESDFLNNKNAQYDAVTKYHKANWGYLEYYGATDYIGEYYKDVKITESGLLAAAHLVGGSAISNTLKDDISISDAYGTKAEEYLELFANYDISYIKE